MIKKNNLAAALHEASGKKQISVTPVVIQKEASPYVLSEKPPSRVGKKVIAGHFDPAVIRQLKLLAMNHDTSIQNMLAESLNDLFEKYNMKPIA